MAHLMTSHDAPNVLPGSRVPHSAKLSPHHLTQLSGGSTALRTRIFAPASAAWSIHGSGMIACCAEPESLSIL